MSRTEPTAIAAHNDSDADVRMLLIENSELLDHLTLNRRESAGLVSYSQFQNGGR